MAETMRARYDHLAITVSDMKRSLHFYRDLLGCQVMGQLLLREGTFRIVYLRSGDSMIELFQFAEPGRPRPETIPDEDIGYKHICFQVDDVDTFAAQLKANGVEFLVEPKMAATTPLRLAFFKDPDGNKIEIVTGKLELEPLDIE